ncbi:MAG: YHS domain-containing (seleno)protein [Pseudomonadota bacterium]|nr:YHS domain-containing (seleno)protein [Pseudomonadota bacterium]
MLNRRTFLLTAAASPAIVALASPALAKTPEVFATDGVAINGYDPVSYFKEETHVRGSETFKTMWKGAEWRFANAENLADFNANPEAYAPQYGGYCAYAVASGYTAKTDPDAWTVHDGKLYLNFNKSVRRRWLKDVPGNIAKGDANWPSVLNA